MGNPREDMEDRALFSTVSSKTAGQEKGGRPSDANPTGNRFE